MIEKNGLYAGRVLSLTRMKMRWNRQLQLCRERKPLGLLFLGGNPEYFHQGVLQSVDVPSVLGDEPGK